MSVNLSTVHPATRPIDAIKIRGITVSETPPTDGQVYSFNLSSNQFIPITISVGGISDAPSDGKQYARKDAGWVEVTGGTGGSAGFDPNQAIFLR